MTEGRLTRNAAKCAECNDVIESVHRHDFVSCKCGNIHVDGGLDYVKRGFMRSLPIDMCEYDRSDTEKTGSK